jgi:hypothetical protein
LKVFATDNEIQVKSIATPEIDSDLVNLNVRLKLKMDEEGGPCMMASRRPYCRKVRCRHVGRLG